MGAQTFTDQLRTISEIQKFNFWMWILDQEVLSVKILVISDFLKVFFIFVSDTCIDPLVAESIRTTPPQFEKCSLHFYMMHSTVTS